MVHNRQSIRDNVVTAVTGRSTTVLSWPKVVREDISQRSRRLRAQSRLRFPNMGRASTGSFL